MFRKLIKIRCIVTKEIKFFETRWSAVEWINRNDQNDRNCWEIVG